MANKNSDKNTGAYHSLARIHFDELESMETTENSPAVSHDNVLGKELAGDAANYCGGVNLPSFFLFPFFISSPFRFLNGLHKRPYE